MKINYCCEKCGECFNDKDKCIEHENNCKIKFPVKIITINKSFNEKEKIKIFTYPNAEKHGNMIKFIPSSPYIDYIHLNRLFLDKIASLTDYYAIHTTNFDKEYEKECIQRLFDYKKKSMYKSLTDYEVSIKRSVASINVGLMTETYNVEVNEDFNKMIDEYSDYDNEY